MRTPFAVVFRVLPLLAALSCAPAGATESIEFVAEHLPEVAMDHRYAALPLWTQDDDHAGRAWRHSLSAAYSETTAGPLRLAGPAFAAGVSRSAGVASRIDAFAFFDDLRFSGATSRRPLDVLFASGVPLSLPVDAEFTGLGGTMAHAGFGAALRRDGDLRFLGHFQWSAGLLWEQLRLSRYAMAYRVTAGPRAGVAGTLDYSATYTHATPIAGLAWPREHGRWTVVPHVQAAVPLPRRGVQGRITGPGFDLAGSTDSNGAGRHFGDPSLTVGCDVTYRPWNLTVDVGSALTQSLLEPLSHEGIDRNWVLNVRWSR